MRSVGSRPGVSSPPFGRGSSRWTADRFLRWRRWPRSTTSPATRSPSARRRCTRSPRLSAHLGGQVEIWAKRDDCNSGIAFGRNKVRKLEYLVPEAFAQGCDTLVSIGGVQSNHTRAVTGVAAHLGLKAVTVQEHWVEWPDVVYDRVGNIQLLTTDGRRCPTRPRWIRHRGARLVAAGARLGARGRRPPVRDPGRASDHPSAGWGSPTGPARSSPRRQSSACSSTT